MIYIVCLFVILWVGFVVYNFREGEIENGSDFAMYAFAIPFVIVLFLALFLCVVYGLHHSSKMSKCETTGIYQFTQNVEYSGYEEQGTGGKIRHTVLVPSQYISVLLDNNQELQINKNHAIIYYNQDKQEIHYRHYCFEKNFIVYLKGNEIND